MSSMEEDKYMLLGHEQWGDGGSWLVCQVLPAIGAVSIFQELAANRRIFADVIVYIFAQ